MTYTNKPLLYFLLLLGLLLGGTGLTAQDEQADAPTAASVDEGDPAPSAAAEEAGTVEASTDVGEGAGDPALGAALWKANVCGSCHAGNMKDNMTGPALAGVQARWAGEPRDHLYQWVQQSQKLIASGKSARAEAVWSQWKPTVMSNYTNLSNADVEHLLAYIKGTAEGTYSPNGIRTTDDNLGTAEETDNTWLFIVLGGALLLLSLILARITSNLQYMVASTEGAAPARRTLVQVLTSRGVIAFAVFALVVLFGYTTVNHAIDLGRQQDYQPEQPIKFSHEVHAGIHKIECQYCHDGARRSKHSVIPAVNTCMNCHRAIQYGSQYGTAEITKIFASIGWDPSESAYIENYDQMTNEQALAVYKKWIANKNYSEGIENPDDLDELVNEQLAGIEAALTNEYTSDERIAGPIEWTRIHNLPDHAYFNHAQHVTVGNLQCQNCHGPVEEMEVVYQYSPLSMGWCINCHRETEVQFSENDYYKSYERYHEEIKEGVRDGVTVEDVGGLNCQRCHY